MSFIVGLTGGIGSGKSAAADQFAARGAALVDTDAIAHDLTGPGGAALAAIRQAFGAEMLTAAGTLDRAAMRQRVFADAGERRRLEAILHPLIRAEVEAQIRRAAGADRGRRPASADFPYVVLVVPLLAETGSYREQVDRVLVVDCPVALQIERVMARNGMARAAVEAILQAQATREARLAIADDVIANDGGLDKLAAQVAGLHARYLELAQTGRHSRDA
jgi:dephospho-CoA kinase